LEQISVTQALEEELFLGLRQLAGIDLDRLQDSYGVSVSDRFTSLEAVGLIERAGSVVRLAPERLSISNEVFVELMR
jgi:oxygen-independent coproporphyrinogen III oxidase